MREKLGGPEQQIEALDENRLQKIGRQRFFCLGQVSCGSTTELAIPA
jgi:hypothetical protein